MFFKRINNILIHKNCRCDDGTTGKRMTERVDEFINKTKEEEGFANRLSNKVEGNFTSFTIYLFPIN